LPIAVQAAKAGFTVYGFDSNPNKIVQLQSGITEIEDIQQSDLLKYQKLGTLKLVQEFPTLSEPIVCIIAVPTPLNSLRKPDLSMLQLACEEMSKNISSGSLIINESTSFIGTLRNFIKPLFENKTYLKNLKFAVAPERIDPRNSNWNIRNTPRLLSGLDDEATNLAEDFYSKFCNIVHLVSKPEVAEAAKLFENTFRHVNIALVNEFSRLSRAFDISTHEIIQAASTKPFGFMPFFPGIGVGGHCIPVDPSYLSYSAEIVGCDISFVDLANRINLMMPREVVSRIQKYLGEDLKNKRIQLAGIAYKPNVSDLRESPALELMEVLKEHEAKVKWCDPLVMKYDGQSSQELDGDIDLGLIVTPHSNIDFTIWKNSKTAVLDLSPTSTQFGWAKFL